MSDLEQLRTEVKGLRDQLSQVTAMLQEVLEPSESWLTVKQSAEFMGVSEWTIRKYAKQGVIKGKRLSNNPRGDFRILKSSLVAPNKQRRRGKSSGVKII